MHKYIIRKSYSFITRITNLNYKMENAGAAADCNTFSWNVSETNGDWFVTREYILRHLVDIISVTKNSGDRRVGRFGIP
jgi:hypothetical protein